jgi:hypothetical protein
LTGGFVLDDRFTGMDHADDATRSRRALQRLERENEVADVLAAAVKDVPHSWLGKRAVEIRKQADTVREMKTVGGGVMKPMLGGETS